MFRGLLGKKLGMTGMFAADGRHLPVTVIELGPCVVTQVKTEAADGYNALQIGFGDKKKSRANKPLIGHMGKSGDRLFSHLKEVAVKNPEEYSVGQVLTLDTFKVGDFVEVTGTSKGRGFSGVMKRHGFHGGRATHGSKSKRVPGSIGCSAWPARVIKGKKMPGHYGVDRKTVKNLEIVDIRPDENLMMIKGAVPGSKSGLITVSLSKYAF
ncbi:MAG: 50S ribosomal protein L3 [Desulfobacterales bacterium]|nr:50S ribosomal protein L3 [Desulfobacterales bacterium]